MRELEGRLDVLKGPGKGWQTNVFSELEQASRYPQPNQSGHKGDGSGVGGRGQAVFPEGKGARGSCHVSLCDLCKWYALWFNGGGGGGVK